MHVMYHRYCDVTPSNPKAKTGAYRLCSTYFLTVTTITVPQSSTVHDIYLIIKYLHQAHLRTGRITILPSIDQKSCEKPTKKKNEMPPKRILVEPSGPRSRGPPKGIIASTYSALTSPENASVVKSVAMFGVCPPPLLSSLLPSLTLTTYLTLPTKLPSR